MYNLSGWNSELRTLIICGAIVACVYFISKAVCYCVKQSHEAKLRELEMRQQFEKDKMAQEECALRSRWQHEDEVRQVEHEWSLESKKV